MKLSMSITVILEDKTLNNLRGMPRVSILLQFLLMPLMVRDTKEKNAPAAIKTVEFVKRFK